MMGKPSGEILCHLVATVPQKAGCITELRHLLYPPGLEEWGEVGVI